MKNKIISIKTCKHNDAKFILSVYNSAIKRKYFSRTRSVKLKDHLKWLDTKLKEKITRIYIGFLNKKRIGYTRFDQVKRHCYEVSIGISPKYYDKGFGSIMIKKAMKKFINLSKLKKISSVVKKNNFRSHKFFLKNGFKLIKFNKMKHFTINKFDLKQLNYYEKKI
jgi:L-amino acid N-acyltransferase YncA